MIVITHGLHSWGNLPHYIPGGGLGESVLADGLNRIRVAIRAPAIIPHRSVRKITIARDASNRQNRNVMAAGAAF